MEKTAVPFFKALTEGLFSWGKLGVYQFGFLYWH